MKKFAKGLILATGMLALTSAGMAATIPIGALQTYGSPSSGGATAPATWVSLASLGTTLGITITPGVTQGNLMAVGGICFGSAGACTTDVAASAIANPILGGFTAASGSTAFLATGLPQFNSSASGDWTTDFANDFVVTSAGTGTFTVPVGAAFLVFVFRDQYYADNVDNVPVDFGVSGPGGAVNPFAVGGVPEPATYTMMLVGLGVVAAFKRLRRAA